MNLERLQKWLVSQAALSNDRWWLRTFALGGALAAMLAKIIAGMPLADGLARPPTDPLWWAVIFGTNLGGNLTPIGSASTLVAVTIIHKHDLRLSFAGFVRKALPFAIMQVVIAAVYVLWLL